MRPLVCLALLAALAAPSAAQTCAGFLGLRFADPDAPPGREGPLPVQSLRVRATYVHGAADGQPTLDDARRDAALTVEGTDTLGASRLSVPGTEVRVATRCGMALLHLEVSSPATGAMVLDAYDPPDHVVVALDGPVPVRAGRFVLDFRAAEPAYADGAWVYPLAALRPAD